MRRARQAGQCLGCAPVEGPHACHGRTTLSRRAPGQHDARAQRLGQHELVSRARPGLGPHPSRVDDALHGEPEDGLLGADGVTAGHLTASVGDHGGGGGQDLADRSSRHPFRERRDVEGENDPSAHGEHVRACVGGCDGAEVAGVVHQRREEIRGRHQGDLVADPPHGSVVERRQADQEGRVGTVRQLPHEGRQRCRAPLGGAAATRRPLGQPELSGAGGLGHG